MTQGNATGEERQPIREIDVLWITAGLGCDGDTIAMTAATQPTLEEVAVEDIVYLGLGLLLAGSSIALLVSGIFSFGHSPIDRPLVANIVPLLDRILLILLVVELLYTVQVSFREHSLIPEPFLLVGLIAGIRRVLVLTAEFARVHDEPERFLSTSSLSCSFSPR